jgi:hypothetical protein
LTGHHEASGAGFVSGRIFFRKTLFNQRLADWSNDVTPRAKYGERRTAPFAAIGSENQTRSPANPPKQQKPTRDEVERGLVRELGSILDEAGGRADAQLHRLLEDYIANLRRAHPDWAAVMDEAGRTGLELKSNRERQESRWRTRHR